MIRLRDLLFEFEDLSWFPNIIRESMTDYLRYVITLLNYYEPITPILKEGLAKTGATQIIDLCSGGGGAIEQIKNNLQLTGSYNLQIVLTDKFPNINAYQLLYEKTNGSISFETNTVDAANVPAELQGFRTIFSGFHHFDISSAKAVLNNAVNANSGIAIFDGGDKNVFVTILITLLQPFAFFFLTPFFKPFKFSRLIFTYLVPLIPICTMWDGVVSMIRLYRPVELLAIARQVEDEKYYWKTGKVKNKLGMSVAYLIGYPFTKDQ
ncbi:MAG: class I SAM-dependent methyltransferase [Bacteroidota bacterium]